ncbi:MAG: hypothetical protein ABIV63_13910 [Caldimonas sp.]
MQTLALVEQIFAAAIGIACVVLLLRQFVGARRRARVDTWLRRTTRSTRGRFDRLVGWPAARRTARREAEEAIRRARGDGDERDGNVVRPKAFRKPRKLH